MTDLCYEPYYNFDCLLDDILNLCMVRGCDQRRPLKSDATPLEAIRALKPRFMKK